MAAGPDGGAAQPAAVPNERTARGGASWILLPVAWCAWLLMWLVPSLLIAPYMPTPRPWLTADAAPAALVAAAALFMTIIWPFWPALAGPLSESMIGGKLAGRTLLEAVILVALAAPFVLVAWSVGGRTIAAGPLLTVAAGLVLPGLGLRAAAVGIGPKSVRWLILGAMLMAVGPLAVAYSVGETIGGIDGRLLEACPVSAAVKLAVGGWPEPGLSHIARLMLWPEIGVMLLLLGMRQSSRRNRAVRA